MRRTKGRRRAGSTREAHLAAVLASAVLALWGGDALGQRGPSGGETPAQSAEARALFQQGIAAADAERWGEAVPFFQRSFELVPRPSTQINLGNALVRAGRVVEGERVLTDFLASPGARADATRAAQARAMLVEARNALVTLVVRAEGLPGGGFSLSLDGRPRGEAPNAQGVWELRVDPGTHTVQLSRASDGAHGDQTATALPGSRVELAVAVRAAERVPLTGPAVLMLSGAPPSASVRIDDVGMGSLRERYAVSPGEHVLEVRAAGFVPMRQTVRGRAGEELRVLVTLAPEARAPRRSVATSPVLWTAVGVVVAGGVATGLYFGLRSEYEGSTGFTAPGVTWGM